METNSQLKIKSIDPRIDSPQIKVSYPSLEYAPIKELPSVLVPIPVQAPIETAQNTSTVSSSPTQNAPISETKTETQNTGTSIVNFFKEHTGIVLLIGLTAFLLGVIYSKNKS
jgi:hypothetical protein